jgi:Fe-S cluster assembly protein SufD
MSGATTTLGAGMLEHADAYLASFEAVEKRWANAPGWLRELRRGAMARFTELGFPTGKLEEWKFTSVAPIARTRFRLAEPDNGPAGQGHGIEAGVTAGAIPAGVPYIVFLNGRYSQAQSNLGGLPKGVRVGSLAGFLKNGRAEEHLARYAAWREEAFVALNTAFAEDGALIEISRGTVLRGPIYVVFRSVPSGEPAMSHPRNLILAGEASQAAIVEVYAGDARGNYFTNAVTELLAGETAVIEHYKLQQESQEAFHVATLQVRQQRSSSFAAHSVSLGGALVRNNVNSVLDGDGAQCTLNGLYLTGGRQHVDNHTVLDHAKPHCGSREYYKGILDGRSSAVFNGGIVVRKDAQKTDAIQSNKNLLLSQDAVINTKPQLQIWADDVRCTHGATIGQLDSEALFYLRSRGIGHDEARHLLTFAFANEVLGRMKLEVLRAHLERQMFARLSKGCRP